MYFDFIAPVLALILQAPAGLVTSYDAQGRLGLEVAAFATTGAPDATGVLFLNEIPQGAVIEAAWLYAHDWSNGFIRPSTPSAVFNGTTLDPVSAFDQDGDNALSAFRWDVSDLLNGSGTYDAFITGTNRNYGAALAVVYSHPSQPHGRVVINDGAVQLSSGQQGVDTESTTLPGIAGSARLWVYTQADDPDTPGGPLTDEIIRVNGSVVGGPLDAGLGLYSSLVALDFEATDGINTVDLISNGDHFGWHIAAAHFVPEPGSLCILGLAMAVLSATRRVARKRAD